MKDIINATKDQWNKKTNETSNNETNSNEASTTPTTYEGEHYS